MDAIIIDTKMSSFRVTEIQYECFNSRSDAVCRRGRLISDWLYQVTCWRYGSSSLPKLELPASTLKQPEHIHCNNFAPQSPNIHPRDSPVYLLIEIILEYGNAQCIPGALSDALAFSQRVARTVAYPFTKSTALGAFEIASALSHTPFSNTIASTRFAVSFTAAQWPTQLHTKQPVAIEREELYTQCFAERWNACT
jgi:hypothetical protein